MSLDMQLLQDKILEDSAIGVGVDIDYAGILEPAPTDPDVVIRVPTSDDEKYNLRRKDVRAQVLEHVATMTSMLDAIDLQLNGGALDVHTERAIARTFGNIIHGIGNIIGHMFNLVGTTLFHGWRDFKRSELTAYCDSNVTLLKRLERIGYNSRDELAELNRMGFELDVPNGMVGTYRDGITCLEQYLSSVNMVSRVNVLKGICEDIVRSIRSGAKDADRYIDTQNRIFSKDDATKHFAATGKVFTDTKTDKVPMSSMYDNIYPFVTDVRSLVSMDKYMRDVASVHGTMESIGVILREVADDKGGVSPQRLKSLSVFTRTIADTFFQYATCVNDLNRLNHNVTMSLRAMRDILKI